MKKNNYCEDPDYAEYVSSLVRCILRHFERLSDQDQLHALEIGLVMSYHGPQGLEDGQLNWLLTTGMSYISPWEDDL